MSRRSSSRTVVAFILTIIGFGLPSCGWQGVNSLPLPGTEGNGPASYMVQAELPDVSNIQPNSRVLLNDVRVGHITKIERRGWHALITMRLNGDVVIPENATAKVGQTSLLGTVHVALAPPTDASPQGRLHNGSVIPLSHSSNYPTTEQTLAVASMFLNGGGLGQVQDITREFSTMFGGREHDFLSLIQQFDDFTGHLNEQKNDIIAATESLNNLVGQFASQKSRVDTALRTIPDALAVLSEQRDSLAEAFDRLGKLSALTVSTVSQTKEALVHELNDISPVLQSLADAGPALTRSLGLLPTFPWPKDSIAKVFRGDALNITMVVDLTLSRLDGALFTGTRWEGNLTELEMQWGRTIGQLPSPVTGGNPLIVPYHRDQGP